MGNRKKRDHHHLLLLPVLYKRWFRPMSRPREFGCSLSFCFPLGFFSFCVSCLVDVEFTLSLLAEKSDGWTASILHNHKWTLLNWHGRTNESRRPAATKGQSPPIKGAELPFFFLSLSLSLSLCSLLSACCVCVSVLRVCVVMVPDYYDDA